MIRVLGSVMFIAKTVGCINCPVWRGRDGGQDAAPDADAAADAGRDGDGAADALLDAPLDAPTDAADAQRDASVDVPGDVTLDVSWTPAQMRRGTNAGAADSGIDAPVVADAAPCDGGRWRGGGGDEVAAMVARGAQRHTGTPSGAAAPRSGTAPRRS